MHVLGGTSFHPHQHLLLSVCSQEHFIKSECVYFCNIQHAYRIMAHYYSKIGNSDLNHKPEILVPNPMASPTYIQVLNSVTHRFCLVRGIKKCKREKETATNTCNICDQQHLQTIQIWWMNQQLFIHDIIKWGATSFGYCLKKACFLENLFSP